MKVIRSGVLPRTDVRRVFVPTMGALHDGHRALIRAARDIAGSDGEVVVSIFVNPTQFGEGEDFENYPRDLDVDLAVCESEGASIVYAPGVEDVYGGRDDQPVVIDPGPLGRILEGEHRPEHFTGVLTVVAILLNKVSPDVAVFGEKDFQQLVLIRKMCRDLAFDVEIVGVPTVRDHDELALSSRNAYLEPDQRERAGAIPRALAHAQQAAVGGHDATLDAARTVLDSAGLESDYLAIRDPDLGQAPERGSARLLLAVRIGGTRLIDNCVVELVGEGGDGDE